MLHLPDPVDYGYEIVNNRLQAKPINQEPAAPELMNDMVCFCGPDACHEGCVCLENEQPCTAGCACEGVLYVDNADSDKQGTCTNIYTADANANNDR